MLIVDPGRFEFLRKYRSVIIIALMVLTGSGLNIGLRPGGSYEIEIVNTAEVGQTDPLDALGEAEEGAVRALSVLSDGVVWLNSPRLQLLGGIDFKGGKGDVLWFQYRGGGWREVARRLIGQLPPHK